MPLYFAYGSNMSVEAMARRCPRSKAFGPARLERHRLGVMREGWLTAQRDPRSAVHGVLWDLALSDVAALDRYEGLAAGLYAKLAQPIITERGPRQAIVYFGANSGPGTARPDYIADVLSAARSWRLPPDAIAALERIWNSAIGDRQPATGDRR
jgi:Gamma-glutamyl cyclotransferase, AIG2-like